MGRLVGLDVGDATIGVAVADELGLTAQPLSVIRRRALRDDLRHLAEVLVDYSPDRFIVGLPLNMNGTSGPQAQKTQEFADALGRHFGLPVSTWDERWSTRAVTRTLIDAGVRRSKRRRVVDKMAAAFILQGYLDSQSSRT